VKNPFNPFWRNTKTEKHHQADPLNTDPPSAVPAGPKEIICTACGCKLARNGEVISTGENYKKFLKHETTVEEKDREISRINTELAEVKRERDALKAAAQGSGSGPSSHRPGARVA
jgi:hypothetical protein